MASNTKNLSDGMTSDEMARFNIMMDAKLKEIDRLSSPFSRESIFYFLVGAGGTALFLLIGSYIKSLF